MEIPEDHKNFLALKSYSPPCSSNIFPADEFQALTAYGCWMEALATGVIQSITDLQRQFLRVCRGEIEPSTLHERAWMWMLRRREIESNFPIVESQEDYGIQEWDSDRWW